MRIFCRRSSALAFFLAVLVGAATALTGLAASTPVSAASARPYHRSVRLLGEHVLPHNLAFSGTIVGGLSGIDYDPTTGQYAIISDDRSRMNPARYYTAQIGVNTSGVHGVKFSGVHFFRRPDGSTYPTIEKWKKEQQGLTQAQRNVLGTVDPEELRIDPRTHNILWTSEGERIIDSPPTLLDPAIRYSAFDGAYRADLPIPANEHMSVADVGPRRNKTLEGLTFAANASLVVSCMEEPLLTDGSSPTFEHGALTRVTVQSRSGPVLAQYAYPLEPLSAAPNLPNAEATNGVSSILAYDRTDPTHFLAVERGGAAGVGAKVRVYEFSTREATNVLHTQSLNNTRVHPVTKKLLVDLDDLGLSRVDNIEGMTWGPLLPDGSRTLILVSDNNFSTQQVTQVIALAIR
ncbi:MAG: 3-phytase [Acidimicrobiales bacterium]|nr:MAG: 3-phytase [Acidimicrobiales bacterium]